jgi:translocation and assembly module TamB
VLGALLALLLALVASAWWGWRSEAGPAWLLEHVPGLKVTGMQGRPDGGPFQVERLEWSQGSTQLRIDALSWRDLQWQWRPYPGAWLRVELLEPRASRVQITTAPEPAAQAPKSPPQDLRLPVELLVRGLHVEALQVNDQEPVLGLRGDLHLGADQGRQHLIGPLEAERSPAQGRIEARIEAVNPLGVQGTVHAAALRGAALPWQADVRLGGTLPRLALNGTLAAGAGARVEVQATLAPFEAWPLAALQATAQALDLSALQATLPATRLSGRAVLTGSGPNAPMSADFDLLNDQPGAWDAGHLPVRRLRATLSGSAAQPQVLDFTIAQAELHGRAEAGQLSGRGLWRGDELSLSLVLDGVQPARIDSRAAPMTLGGPLGLSLRGLRAPSSPAPASASANALSGEVHADLTGRLQRGPAQPVRLLGDATFSAPPDGTLQASVPRLELNAADARAVLSAEVRRDASQAWHVRSTGNLLRFDPADWWAGPEGSAWRHGAQALNADWKADLVWPQATAPQTPAEVLRALRGRADLSLSPSRLAGVAVSGTGTVQAGDRATQLDGTLNAGNNRASAQWMAADDTGEHWHLAVQAPALGALAPLGRLLPGAQAWMPKAGSIDADLVAQGRWPALRTEGHVQAGGVQAGAWRVGRLEARWNATPDGVDAPLSLHLTGSGLAQGEQRIETLAAELSGTLGSHRLQLQAASPLRPPEWTDAVISGGAAPPRGSALHLVAVGGWTPAAPGGGVWRGRVEELTAVAQPRAGTPWIEARGLTGEVRLGPQGSFEQAALQPGRLRLLGATLQWTDARVQARPGGVPPLIALDARLDPLPVVPWLRQAQPHFGWGGDLRVGATMRVASAERLDADVVVERAGGDLTVTDDTGTRALGLTDLRLSLAAHDGLWQLTQAMAGQQVGVLSGAQSVRAASASAWPTADAPLQGNLVLRVADLAPWSAWLPPGWRLAGRLQAGGALAGQLGAPRYTGQITGSDLAVRNLLQGVYLHDGNLAVSLNGTEARIDRLMFRGGDGTLRMEGNASLGDSPSARLRIVAERFQALARLDRRMSLSGQAGIELSPERLGVQGRFVVDEGLIDVSQASAPRLDDDVTVLHRPAGKPVGARTGSPASAPQQAPQEAPRSPWKNTDVSLLVNLGENLRLVGRGLKAGLRGELRITTPEGQLQVHGTVRTERGTYAAYGQNLSIERGVITLAGDVTSPRIDILAVRPDVDVRVGVTVQGPALQPRVRLYSEPEMSEMDKLSWLVMGRASEGLGRADTALLQRAALALLAGERSGDSPGLVQRLGLDDLGVKRGESGELADTVVTLGKQISQRWYVAYERGLNAAAGSWQLIYRVARRYTLRLQAGESRSLDLIWTWRWN